MDVPGEIVNGCRTGDKKAQFRLYEMYSPLLLGICLRYTNSRDDAHDVLQESFIRIFNKITQVNDSSQLQGWMRKVTVSTAINFYHRHKKHQQSSSLDAVMFKVVDDNADAIGSLHAKDLLALIAKLPEGYRIIFNLFVIEGYSHKEIADLLKITEGTSKSQLNHARLWLKNYITTNNVNYHEQYG